VEALEPRDERPAAALGRYLELARDYARQAKAPNTRRAYRSDWADFSAWCREHGLEPLPAQPSTIAAYLAFMAEAGAKVSTIQRRVSSIAQVHRATGQEPPPTADWTVRQVLRGIRRELGSALQEKAPLLPIDLRELIAGLDLDSLRGKRDRAILLLGFAGAFRRSELISLDWEHVGERPDGLAIRLPWSKTDPEGEGELKGIPYGRHPVSCPVLALRAWQEASGLTAGPVFRGVARDDRLLDERFSDRGVARVVQRAARLARRRPEQYAGHSLRAGLATAAAEGKAPSWVIRKQTGHHSDAMLERYIRSGRLFVDNAVTYTDL
jgi:site-specific recombinase XerD